MKQFGRQLHTQAKSVKLRAVERAELKERLQMYMEYHPLPASQKTTATAPAGTRAVTSGLRTTAQRWFAPFAGMSAVILIFILPVIAEQAVPGDLLYPMKVQINEELRSTLIFSSQEKIEWETTRIERRLAEARLLESQGRLTTELEQAVAAAVRTHAKNTEAQIAALREIDADEAAVAEVSFASSLAIQSEVLSQTQSNRPSDSPASPVLLAVQSEEEEANARSASSTPSYERMLALIETETTTATELFHSIKDSISAEEVARIEDRFADLQEKIHATVAQHQESESLADNTLLSIPTGTTSEDAIDTSVLASSATSSHAEIVTLHATTATSGVLADNRETEAEVDSDDTVDVADDAEVNEGTTTTAVDELRAVLRDVKRIIRFMSDITVRESVSIDEWIPATLSNEEQITDLHALLTEMERIRMVVAEETLSASTSVDVEGAQQELVQNIFTIEELLRANDIETAEEEVATSYQEAQRLLALVQERVLQQKENGTTTATSSNDTDTDTEDVPNTDSAID